jgi:phage terminase large subunit
VLDGIRDTATSLKNGYIRIMPDLNNFDMEINGYVWDESEIEDRPIKVNDHLMDAMRYFVRTAKIAKGKADYQLSWT